MPRPSLNCRCAFFTGLRDANSDPLVTFVSEQATENAEESRVGGRGRTIWGRARLPQPPFLSCAFPFVGCVAFYLRNERPGAQRNAFPGPLSFVQTGRPITEGHGRIRVEYVATGFRRGGEPTAVGRSSAPPGTERVEPQDFRIAHRGDNDTHWGARHDGRGDHDQKPEAASATLIRQRTLGLISWDYESSRSRSASQNRDRRSRPVYEVPRQRTTHLRPHSRSKRRDGETK